MARELATHRLRVVVLEQGPYLHGGRLQARRARGHATVNALTNDVDARRRPFRTHGADGARRRRAMLAVRPRRRRRQRALHGELLALPRSTSRSARSAAPCRHERSPTGRSRYADLEPYYTKVEWEIGVSGSPGNPFEPPRSQAVPDAAAADQIVRRAARARRAASSGCTRGRRRWPSLSQPYRGRSGVRGTAASASASAASAREVERARHDDSARPSATGRCEIRPHSYVRKRRDRRARPRHRRVVLRPRRSASVMQRAKAVVLCANGARDAAAAAHLRDEPFPERARELERRRSGRTSCSTAARLGVGAVRARGQRLQGRRRDARRAATLRARPEARPLRRWRHSTSASTTTRSTSR